MFRTTRYSHTKILSPTQAPFQPLLTFQRCQCFLNLFNKDAYANKASPRKKITFYDKNIFERVAQTFKESLLDGPQYEFQKEKRLVLKEAKKKEELAQRYFNLGQYQDALENFKGTLYLLRKHFKEDDPRLAHYLHKIGDVYYEVKEWDQAINAYEEGLELLANSFGPQDGEVGRCYFLLGMCYFKQKKYAFAIENLNKALKIYKVYPLENQQAIASCYSMLAECYHQFGKFKKVYENTEKLINLLREMYKDEKIKEDNDPLMTQYYLSLGISIAHAKKNYKEAFLYLNKYLNSQISMKVNKGSGIGICYLKMGQIQAMQGNHNDALEYFNKSIEVAYKSAGYQSKILGSCYNAIGASQLEMGNYEEALKEFTKGIKFFEEDLCLERAVCHRNTGIALEKIGNKNEAIQSYIKSSEDRAKIFEDFPEGDLESSVLNACISGLSYENGDMKTGVIYYEKTLENILMTNAKEAKSLIEKKKENCKLFQ